MKRYSAIKKAQAEAHRRKLDQLAELARQEADRLGVSISFFGSYVEGRLDNRSDLDIALSARDDPDRLSDFRTFMERSASKLGVDVDIVTTQSLHQPPE